MNSKDFETDISGFPKGYGKFPYLIIRAGIISSMFFQVPIHFIKKGDDAAYEGIIINDFPYDHKNITDNHTADLLFDRLMFEAEQYQKSNTKLFKGESQVCLVLNPETAYFFSKEGKSFYPEIPSGGGFKTVTGKEIKTLDGNHFLRSEYEQFLLTKNSNFVNKEKLL